MKKRSKWLIENRCFVLAHHLHDICGAEQLLTVQTLSIRGVEILLSRLEKNYQHLLLSDAHWESSTERFVVLILLIS